jgi:hypothetical protein
MLARRVYAVALVGLLACEQPPAKPSTKTTASRHAPTPVDGGFGGSVWGYVEASSGNGRIAVLRWFPGDQPPRFGHHGEASVDPTLTVFDLVSATQRPIEQIVDVNVSRSHLLVLADDGLWLIVAASGEWEQIADVDLESDSNGHVPPRQAAFSPNGERMAWIAASAYQLNIRELASGESWTVASEGRIWRAWPSDTDRGAVLYEVSKNVTGWPTQDTSCPCNWCQRFADSCSSGPIDPSTFEIIAVGEDGDRRPGEVPEYFYDFVGPTGEGCTIHATEAAGERLERGPWRWKCL